MLAALLTGIGISIINTAIGFVVIFYAINKEWRIFSRLLTISITSRFIFLAFAIWYSISVFNLQSSPLAISFVSCTFILIILEVILINNKFKYIKIENIIKE